jgi:hypothetical protein
VAELAAAVLIAFVMTPLLPALAVTRFWNSAANPLTVSGYDSTGFGYGEFWIASGSSGTLYWAKTYQKINNANNHRVYAELTYWSNEGYCIVPSFIQCDTRWYREATDTTYHSSAPFYQAFFENAPIDPYANYHRLSARMKLDIPWRPDPGGGTSYTLGIEY